MPGATAIIISISSDIGEALAQRWHAAGWKVFGTHRTSSAALSVLQDKGISSFHCDLSSDSSVRAACANLLKACPSWDSLILCPGNQEPVGAFSDIDFEQWSTSIQVNFTNQMRIIHALLPNRKVQAMKGPIVLSFAGGGTNNAPQNYSGYIISKIALMKMTEILDAECPDTRFAIVGPGWVKTKIHAATLEAPEKAGSNYQRTLEKLNSGDLTPMAEVLDCCDWLVAADREIIGGRNFSVVFDAWGDSKLDTKLRSDQDMYKLRRWGNDFMQRGR